MKKYLIITLLTQAYSFNANAQSTIDTVLANIARNNKSIIANTQFWEAQKLHYKTGLTPYNPAVNYDYMLGSPATAGNQTDFTVTQAFDFPSAYAKRKQLSEQQFEQVEFQLTAKRQDVLLEAKLVCLELVYRNKLQIRLNSRKKTNEALLSDFQAKLNNGDGNILDANKAQLQLIEINKEFQQNLSSINQLNQKLTALNGGNEIVFADTLYQASPGIPPFEQLESEIEANDPVRKCLEQEKLITQKQVELSKALTLPKIETGYHYQGILGQTFQGIHAGITIPLWENKNRVKAQQANVFFADLNVQYHRNEHYHEIKQLYEKYENLRITLAEYEKFNKQYAESNTSLIDKSLALGQISTIEYFLETSYYNNAFDNYLETEKEYYEVIAELFKHRM